MFYSSLQVAISRSRYSNLNLKPKQVQCLETIYSGRDVVAVFLNAKKKSDSSDLELDVSDANYTLLKDAKYDMIFTYPGALCRAGMEWSCSKANPISALLKQ